eukprot:scaffold98368_cov61-Phaeocystis_antarctica.AAC.2
MNIPPSGLAVLDPEGVDGQDVRRATEHPLYRVVTAEHCGELGRAPFEKGHLGPIALGYEWRQKLKEVAHGRRRVDDIPARRQAGPVGRAGAEDAPHSWPVAACVRQQRTPAHLRRSQCMKSISRASASTTGKRGQCVRRGHSPLGSRIREGRPGSARPPRRSRHRAEASARTRGHKIGPPPPPGRW